MPRIGIRELKARASEIVQAVREEKARYIITYRGVPVGVLSPIDEQQLDAVLEQVSASHDAEVWAELEELSQEIGRARKEEKSGVELLSEMRGAAQPRRCHRSHPHPQRPALSAPPLNKLP